MLVNTRISVNQGSTSVEVTTLATVPRAETKMRMNATVVGAYTLNERNSKIVAGINGFYN